MQSPPIPLPQKNVSQSSSKIAPRLKWLDQAKAYGMVLVYYGHFVEQLAVLDSSIAALQYKFIYSFHMPLFFILSGYVYKQKKEPFIPFFKRLIRTRLIPVLFFNLLALLLIVSDDVVSGVFSVDLLLNGFQSLLLGHPPFNKITWFLVCLFTVELINYGLQRYLQTVRKIAIAILLFFVSAEWLHWQFGNLLPGTGITSNFWFVDESLYAYPLFLLGTLLKRLDLIDISRSTISKIGISLASFIFVLLTFNLNPNGFLNPFISDAKAQDFAVRMANSIHGNLLLFVATAIAGSLLILSLAQLIPFHQFVLFIGRNTLILLGLNHFFFVVFGRVAPKINPYLNSHGSLFIACAVLTAISLVLCVPCITILNRYLPQWIGRRNPAS